MNNKKLLFVTQVKESTYVKENSVDYLLKLDEYYQRSNKDAWASN